MDLQSILGNVLKGNMSQTISDKTGLTESQVEAAVNAGLPMILGGMAKNAENKDGAESLDTALQEHTNSPVVNDPTKATSDSARADGGKILDHVFGTGKGSVSETIAKTIDADPKAVQSALTILAPIAIGYLAKHKMQNNLDAGGVADSLKKN